MRDPYDVLGVAKSATEGEIKTAFRRLAKKYHPDANKNDPKAQDRFGEISRAYEIVGDAAKRKQFDRGEIDAEGCETHSFAGGNPFGGGFRQRNTGGSGGAGGFSPEDIINTMFGGGGFSGGGEQFGGPRPRQNKAAPQKGKDIEIALSVTASDVLGEGKARLKLPDGRIVAVNIPEGVENGQIIRLKGQGLAGPAGHRGDVMAKVIFKSDAGSRIEGANLIMDVDLPLSTAVKGGKITVKTPKGKVALKVAPWSDSGTTLRIKGRGLPKKAGGNGDILVVLRIMLDETDRSALEKMFA